MTYKLSEWKLVGVGLTTFSDTGMWAVVLIVECLDTTVCLNIFSSKVSRWIIWLRAAAKSSELAQWMLACGKPS